MLLSSERQDQSYDGGYCARNGAQYLEAAEYGRVSDPDWVG
jgi:hypothetical protein